MPKTKEIKTIKPIRSRGSESDQKHILPMPVNPKANIVKKNVQQTKSAIAGMVNEERSIIHSENHDTSRTNGRKSTDKFGNETKPKRSRCRGGGIESDELRNASGNMIWGPHQTDRVSTWGLVSDLENPEGDSESDLRASYNRSMSTTAPRASAVSRQSRVSTVPRTSRASIMKRPSKAPSSRMSRASIANRSSIPVASSRTNPSQQFNTTVTTPQGRPSTASRAQRVSYANGGDSKIFHPIPEYDEPTPPPTATEQANMRRSFRYSLRSGNSLSPSQKQFVPAYLTTWQGAVPNSTRSFTRWFQRSPARSLVAPLRVTGAQTNLMSRKSVLTEPSPCTSQRSVEPQRNYASTILTSLFGKTDSNCGARSINVIRRGMPYRVLVPSMTSRPPHERSGQYHLDIRNDDYRPLDDLEGSQTWNEMQPRPSQNYGAFAQQSRTDYAEEDSYGIAQYEEPQRPSMRKSAQNSEAAMGYEYGVPYEEYTEETDNLVQVLDEYGIPTQVFGQKIDSSGNVVEENAYVYRDREFPQIEYDQYGVPFEQYEELYEERPYASFQREYLCRDELGYCRCFEYSVHDETSFWGYFSAVLIPKHEYALTLISIGILMIMICLTWQFWAIMKYLFVWDTKTCIRWSG